MRLRIITCCKRTLGCVGRGGEKDETNEKQLMSPRANAQGGSAYGKWIVFPPPIAAHAQPPRQRQ